MNTKNNERATDTLRYKAEESLKKRMFKTTARPSEVEALKLIQELEVHKIELEMQNEELQQAKEAERLTADKYIHLYDFAPLGYYTLSKKGFIIELNLEGAKLLGKDTWFYAANNDFVTLEQVSANTARIASANWHASARALAMHTQDALLIDIGSTTTDIIAIEAGKVVEYGLSDASRMQADMLVYAGVVRTPVMALAQKLVFEETEINVAAEYFATMADVYRLTDELPPESDMAETADGKGKSALESARRLARMIGHDVESKPIESWKDLATTCKNLQLKQIKAAILKHLKSGVLIIGAGAGSFLTKQLALDLGHTYQPISMCLPEHINLRLKHDLEVCFPAYAVALLAKKQLVKQYA